MRKYSVIFSSLILLCVFTFSACTFAATSPMPSEFGGAALAPGVPVVSSAQEQLAHPIWLILSGQGLLGALLVGAFGLVFAWVRPYIVMWMKERRLERFYFAVESTVSKYNAKLTEGMKRANADGKLTKDEADRVFAECKGDIVAFIKRDGSDILKKYGDSFIDAAIEFAVSRLKNPLARAVAVPLSRESALAPIPPSVSYGATPEWTDAASGLTTPVQAQGSVSVPSPTN